MKKKDLKKKLHAVLDKTKAGKGAVKNAEIQQMARELLGMVATVDNEREHLRQVGEAYAKLAGENVDLLGKDTAGGSKVSFKAVGRTIMGLNAAKRMSVGRSRGDAEEEEQALARQMTGTSDQGLAAQLSAGEQEL